jgi:hypothetical protein
MSNSQLNDILLRKENTMNQKSNWTSIVVMVVFGLIGLSQFSRDVRLVQVIGLFASGAAFGAAFVTVIRALITRNKQL